MKYAAYYKRVISSFIDVLILYFPCIILYYFYHMDIGFIFKASFAIGIFYHFMFYKECNQTFGEMCLKLKLIFTSEVKHKNYYYLSKAFFLSSVYFPFSFPAAKEFSVFCILVSIVSQIYPTIRTKKLLIWDVGSKTAVIEDEKSL
jgi:hypothetical protein